MNSLLPKAVSFDLDGTLIDSLPGIKYSIGAAMEQCGVSPKEIDLRSIIGPPIRLILGKLSDAHEAELDALEDAFRRSYDSEGWRRTELYPGTQAAIATLHAARVRLFVVTNKPRHISMRILKLMQIEHCFERIITRDSRLPHYANKQEMLEELRISCALASSDCVFVGDTVEDGVAAAKCGMQFAYVTYGYGTISQTDSVPVHFQTSDLSELFGMNPTGVFL